jgi:hypothetical protein
MSMAEAREEHADAIRAMAEYIATTEDVMIWTPTALLRATFLHIQEFEQRESAFVAALREYTSDLPLPFRAVFDGWGPHPNWQSHALRAYESLQSIVAAHDAREAPGVGAGGEE